MNMARRYGRSIGKKRVVDHVPLNTPKNTTILSALRYDGTTVKTFFDGAINGDRFLSYLKELLVPKLRKGDFVVMDNLTAHKVKGVTEIIRNAEAIPLYLPPYSPDLNPIEHMWSKIKSFLRKLRPRTADELAVAISVAFAQVTGDDCTGWFTNCGYSF